MLVYWSVICAFFCLGWEVLGLVGSWGLKVGSLGLKVLGWVGFDLGLGGNVCFFYNKIHAFWAWGLGMISS